MIAEGRIPASDSAFAEANPTWLLIYPVIFYIAKGFTMHRAPRESMRGFSSSAAAPGSVHRNGNE